MKLNDPLSTKIITSEKLKIVTEKIDKLTKNPPSMVCVNVILNGEFALKYMICKEIMASVDITDQDSDWYLLCAGIESELKKLYTIGVVDEKSDEV